MDRRIIISRTDNIGDVVLTLPMAGILKQQFPDCYIIFLGKGYTKPIIDACVYVDEFADWDEIMGMNRKDAVKKFQSFEANVIVHVFPNRLVAQIAQIAKIETRIATKSKFYNLLAANKLLKFSRSKSNLHEAQLNTLMLEPLGYKAPASFDVIASKYGLKNIAPLSSSSEALLRKDKFNLILHPKSKGSAKEWGLENFKNLIEILDEEKYNIFITGTEREGEEIKNQLPFDKPNVTNLCGKLSLEELISFISQSDGLIANSTGPLHIAAALGIIAIGLFSMRRPIFPSRWAPIGRKSYYVVYDERCPDCLAGKDCDCITKIEPKEVKTLLEKIERVI